MPLGTVPTGAAVDLAGLSGCVEALSFQLKAMTAAPHSPFTVDVHAAVACLMQFVNPVTAHAQTVPPVKEVSRRALCFKLGRAESASFQAELQALEEAVVLGRGSSRGVRAGPVCRGAEVGGLPRRAPGGPQRPQPRARGRGARARRERKAGAVPTGCSGRIPALPRVQRVRYRRGGAQALSVDVVMELSSGYGHALRRSSRLTWCTRCHRKSKRIRCPAWARRMCRPPGSARPAFHYAVAPPAPSVGV